MNNGIARAIVQGKSHANSVSLAGHHVSNLRANASHRQEGSRTISRPSFKDCFLTRESARILCTLCLLGPGKDMPWDRAHRYAIARAIIVTAVYIEFSITAQELSGSTPSIIQMVKVDRTG